MKKFLMTAAVILAACSAVDAQNKIYCEVTGSENLFNKKVQVSIDFGQNSSYYKDDRLVDENGDVIKFTTMIDALNYMASLGWEVVDGYMYVIETGIAPMNVYKWLLERDFEDGTEFDDFYTKQMFKDERKDKQGDDSQNAKAPAVSIVQDTDGTISSNSDGTSLVAAADGAYMLRLDSSRQVKIGSSWEEAEAVIKNLYSMFSALNKDETGAVTCGGVQYTVKHKSALGSESLVFVDIDENSGITKEALVQYLKDGRAWSSARQ